MKINRAIRSEKSCKIVSTCAWIGGRAGKAVSGEEDEEDASPCVYAASQVRDLDSVNGFVAYICHGLDPH